MTRYWNQLEGVSLAGRHWLKQCLTSTADDAWYLTRYDVDTDAAVRVIPANTKGAEEQLEMWRTAMDFDHPHIVRMLDAGRTEAEGADLMYAVCEYPDDFVAGVLAERPLAPGEAMEVMKAALAGLGYLHERGLAHGAVDSSHVMAFGDTIKLPSDTIVAEGAGASASDDMRSFGALLHEALTQQQPEEGEQDFAYLPEPFATIVRNTMKPSAAERWTAEDVKRYLNPPARSGPEAAGGVEAAAAQPVEGEGVRKAAGNGVDGDTGPLKADERPDEWRAPASGAEGPRVAARGSGVEGETRRVKADEGRGEGRRADRGFPMKWVPVAGLVAAIGLSVVIFRKPAPVAPPPAVETAKRPQPVQPPTPSRRVEAPASAAVTRNPAAIWRVVAYTYNSRGAAEKKARSINEKNPRWRAEVFAPRGDRTPFYVALGGRLTRAEAERLQREALSKGMPRDTFVRNFSN